MIFRFYKENKRLLLIILILPILSIFIQHFSSFKFLNDENGIIEWIQTIFLLSNLYLLLKYFKRLKLITNLKYLLIKIATLSLLIYEEHSYLPVHLTKGQIDFSGGYNIQNEFNIHNAKIFTTAIFNNIPIFDSISLGPILMILFLFLISFGSYLPVSKDIKFLFLDKKFSIFPQIYIINLLITRFLFMPNDMYVIESELIELYIYLIFLLDTKNKCAKCIRISNYKKIK